MCPWKLTELSLKIEKSESEVKDIISCFEKKYELLNIPGFLEKNYHTVVFLQDFFIAKIKVLGRKITNDNSSKN